MKTKLKTTARHISIRRGFELQRFYTNFLFKNINQIICVNFVEKKPENFFLK